MTLEEENEKLRAILSSIVPDKLPGPFICGVIGDRREDGMYEGYMICPSYGADVQCTVAYYRKTKDE